MRYENCPKMKRFLGRFAVFLMVTLVGAGVYFWTPDADSRAMRTKYGAPPSQFVDLGNDLTVHLRDEGPSNAPVVLLLHGANASLRTWDQWTRILSTRYRVIRFDQIGHGLTGPNPSGRYDAEAFTATVDAVMTKLGVSKFVIGGNSMGGWVSYEYARRHPERLNGVLLVDAFGAQPKVAPKLPIGFRIAQTPGLRNAILYFTPRSLVEKSLRQSVSNQAVVTPAEIDEYWEMLRYPGNRQATIDRAATMRALAKPGDVAGIKVPTLILWGDEDKLIPVDAAMWFNTNIPDSKLIIYPKIGHLPMEETSETSARDVMNWLATIPAPR
jgi:pimeloyl-ACP methyl ester carboxylesterase